MLGSMLVQYALMWHLTMTTQSGTVMMLAAVVGFLPMMFFAPLGGVWADRLPRRFLIAASDALAALSTLALFVAILLGHSGLWTILGAMALRAVGQALQGPAVTSILPQIVPSEHLLRINGYNASIQGAIGLSSPLLAGALLSVLPMRWVLLIDVVTAALAITIMLAIVRVTHTPPADDVPSIRADLVAGLRYVHRHPFVARLNAYFAFTLLVSSPVMFLTPLQVTRSFSNDVWRLTVIEVAFFIGMSLGGALIGRWGGLRRHAATIAGATIVLGALSVLLGIPQGFITYNVWMFLVGIFVPMLNAPTMTLLQQKVEPAYLGRVMSIMSMISAVAMPAGMLVFGPLADRVAVEWLLIGSGLLAAACGVALLRDRTIKAAEEASPTLR